MRVVRALAVAVAVLAGTAAAGALTPRTWSLSLAPVGAGVSSSPASSVSCATDQFCVQIGGVGGRLTAIVYSATSSRRMALPAPIDSTRPAQASVEAVDCPSRELCVAVGEYETYDRRERPLVETYRGGTWRATTISGTVNELNGVACNATQCLATGTSFSNSFDHGFLAVRTADGTWSAPPVREAPFGYAAEQPVCPPQGACTAQARIESGPGGDELLRPTPDGYEAVPFPAADGSQPLGLQVGPLSCPTAQCTGLGTYQDEGHNHLLVETLGADGSLSATQLALPGAVADTVSLRPIAMACTEAAAGLLCASGVNVYFGGPEPHATLVQLRSGSWRVRLAPVPPGAQLASVGVRDASCSTYGHCAVVGSFRSGAGRTRPLVEDLADPVWQPVVLAVPDQLSASDDVELSDVSCAGHTCLAAGGVGYRPNNDERQLMLVARYG